MSSDTINPELKSDRDRAEAERRLLRSSVINRFFESRLRLSQLRMMVAIADLGQLKKVADALNVTPPAVSKQLAELEDALGERVLTRVGNRVEFTGVGELLARRARDVLAQLERARIEVDEMCSGISARIGIGAVQTVAPVVFPALVLALRNRAPNAAVRLLEGRFAELAPQLSDGTLDLVFARDTTQVTMEDFRQVTVMADPLAVVCGAQHPLAASRQLDWRQLEGIPWVLPLRGSSTYMHLESLLLRHGLHIPRGSVESDSWSGSAGILQTHLFLALFPLAYARRFLQSQNLAVLPLPTEGIQDSIQAVWRLDDEAALIAMLIDVVRQLPASI